VEGATTAKTSESRAEKLVQQLEDEVVSKAASDQIEELRRVLKELDDTIDCAYSTIMSSRKTQTEDGNEVDINSAAEWRLLAREEPEV
jgi:hypothetical protein